MAAKIKTQYLANFNVPRTCVVCGAPPSPALTYKVSGSKSDWSGKRTTTLRLEFPVCQAFHDVSRETRGAKLVRVVGGLVAIGFCLLMAGVVGSGTFDNPFPAIVIGLALLLGLGFGARSLAKQFNERDLTPEQRQRRGLAQRCVRIAGFKTPGLFDKQGWILFTFENSSFAAEFSTLSRGAPA